MTKRITLPITDEDIKSLKAGDSVLLTGTIITGRDAAHKRLYELLQQGKELPVDLRGEIIYYVGPAPAKPGYVVGPAGPTSSYRMDKYTPALLDLGMKGMIGKGARSQEVIDAIEEHQEGRAALLRGSGHRGGAPLYGRGLPLHRRRRQRGQQRLPARLTVLLRCTKRDAKKRLFSLCFSIDNHRE